MAQKKQTEVRTFVPRTHNKRPGQHSKKRPPAKRYRGQGR